MRLSFVSFRTRSIVIFATVALAIGNQTSCNDSDDDTGDDSVTPATTDAIAFACAESDGVHSCDRAKVSEWSKTQEIGSEYNFTLPASGNSFTVTDAAGAVVESIKLTQGVPVRFVLKGDATNAHYLNEPLLWANSVVRSVDSKDSYSFSAPYINGIENRKTTAGADGFELAVTFVPMVRGSYNIYCQIGVNNGNNYDLIRSSAVTPDLASGHAGATGNSMKIAVEVTGDAVVELSTPYADEHAARMRAAFDNHPWADNGSYATLKGPNWTSAAPSGQHLWATSSGADKAFTYTDDSKCTGRTNSITPKASSAGTEITLPAIGVTGYCKFLNMTASGSDVRFSETSDSSGTGSVDVTESSPMKLRTGHAHILRISNNSESDVELDVAKLTTSFAIRKLQDKYGEYKVDFLTGITIKPGKWMEIWAVPMVAGSYVLTSSNGSSAPIQVVDTL